MLGADIFLMLHLRRNVVNTLILAGVNKKSLKNTLFRLASTGYIIRAEQKIGRGGWVKYSLNSCLFEELNNIGVVYGLKKR